MSGSLSGEPALIDAATLAALLPAPPHVLLALDFDGTLAPIVNHPADAALLPEIKLALQRLSPHVAVAVISGRPLSELQTRFDGVSHVILAAGHGHMVCDTDGFVHTLSDTHVTPAVCEAIADTVRQVLPQNAGWQVEVKPSGVAVHHRNVTEHAVAAGRARVLEVLQRHTTTGTFRLLHGHCVDELAIAAVTKGDVLTWLAKRFPERTPIVFGDDTTDEDMFAIAHDMNGAGILVADAPRESGAFYRVKEPADVATFLTLFAARLSSPHR